jgi:hypothetical protein
VDDDDVDHSLIHITSNPLRERQSRKGKTQQIEWDESLEEMQHDKNVAQAQSGPYHLHCGVQVADVFFPLRPEGTIASQCCPSNGQNGNERTRSSTRFEQCLLSAFIAHISYTRYLAKPLKAAPPLPTDPHLPPKPPKTEMEDFLDDLLG